MAVGFQPIAGQGYLTSLPLAASTYTHLQDLAQKSAIQRLEDLEFQQQLEYAYDKLQAWKEAQERQAWFNLIGDIISGGARIAGAVLPFSMQKPKPTG